MTWNELYYKKVISSIGWTLMIWWGLIQGFGLLLLPLQFLLSVLSPSDVIFNLMYQLFYAAGYLTVFMLPVAFLRWILKCNGCQPQTMRLSPSVSPWLPLLVFAGVAICFSAAQLNAALVSVFDYASFSSDVLWGETGSAEAYEVVLNWIVISVVPGFCEEFLFRGAILENCLPFGRSKAILISAFLFAMMHQNAEQLLYTFVAGVVLGLIYTRTGNIWCGTVVHLINNFISVLETVIYDGTGGSEQGVLMLSLLEGGIYCLGAVSVCILIVRFFSQKATVREGFFERELPAADDYAPYPVDGARGVRLFCTPSMLLFVGLCALQTGFLILMAVGI